MKQRLSQVSRNIQLRDARGFTLIELMIVVAVVAILAAIAYPSYQEHVRKTRRAQARVDMMETIQQLERRYSARNSYATPTGQNQADIVRSTQPVFYTVSFDGAPDATTFTLQAEPVSGSGQANDKCGTLSINQAGTKSQTGTGMTNAECW